MDPMFLPLGSCSTTFDAMEPMFVTPVPRCQHYCGGGGGKEEEHERLTGGGGTTLLGRPILPPPGLKWPAQDSRFLPSLFNSLFDATSAGKVPAETSGGWSTPPPRAPGGAQTPEQHTPHYVPGIQDHSIGLAQLLPSTAAGGKNPQNAFVFQNRAFSMMQRASGPSPAGSSPPTSPCLVPSEASSGLSSPSFYDQEQQMGSSKGTCPGDSRWWTRSSHCCALSGFPIAHLPYPPFKLRIDSRKPTPHSLVDGKLLAMQVISSGELLVGDRELRPSDLRALDEYVHRCKLGPFRPSKALALKKEASSPDVSPVDRAKAEKEYKRLVVSCTRELDKLKRIQENRLKQLRPQEECSGSWECGSSKSTSSGASSSNIATTPSQPTTIGTASSQSTKRSRAHF